MGASEETLTLLRSMDKSLKQLVSLLGSSRSQGGASVASDADLDGQHGNPKVPFNPRAWKGQSFRGQAMSACPAEFLDALAEAFDDLAGKADENNETHNGKPVAPYKRRDAARARGWAARVRAGKVAAPAAQASAVPVVPASWGADVAEDDGDPFAGAGVGAADIPWGAR